MVETLRDNSDSDNEDALDRRSRILGGASAFLRYGFERASMANIASGAVFPYGALPLLFQARRTFFGLSSKSFAQNPKHGRQGAEGEAKPRRGLDRTSQSEVRADLALTTESPHGVELVEATHRLTAPAITSLTKRFMRWS